MPLIEDLNFNRNHIRPMPQGTLDVDEQMVNTPQIFPDNTLVGDKISELSVTKLVSGTITSQQIGLATLTGSGDVYIKAGTVNVTAWTATGGFIMGLDDSDSGAEKFFMGDGTSSIDWNVTSPDTLTIIGNFINIDSTTGEIQGKLQNVVSLTAGETINGATLPVAVFLQDSDNEVYACDGNVLTKLDFIGFAITNGTDGNAITVQTDGVVTGFTGLTYGAKYYVQDDKTIGTSVGTYEVLVGQAMSTTTILIQRKNRGDLSIFGDGHDGNVTISADTSLSSDMYYNNLTIDTTKTLNPNGYRIFVKDTLTINGTGAISRNGNVGGNASGGTAGTAAAALAAGSIGGAVAGQAGGTGTTGAGANGGNGTDQTRGYGANGVAGGNGGTGTGGAIGTGGTAGTRTLTAQSPTNSSTGILMREFGGSGSIEYIQASAGAGAGGSGAGNGAAALGGGGGGSGGSGGIIIIAAQTINNNGSITAAGGIGGNGGNSSGGVIPGGAGGGGGGSAGGGGVILILFSNFITTGTISVAGGVKGTGGTGNNGGGAGTGDPGVDGSNGNAGTIVYLQT